MVRSLLHASLSVEQGFWKLATNLTGFVTVVVVFVGMGMWARCSAAPLPGTFTGVAPKGLLGVTLGPHEICRFWVHSPWPGSSLSGQQT